VKSLHTYTAEFIEAITAAGAPPSIAMQCETYLVRALENAERDRRRAQLAADLMPKLGAQTTAERLGCHRSTVYRRARKVALTA
jgi:transcriptional regulator of acetoin/glycerol metabolism